MDGSNINLECHKVNVYKINTVDNKTHQFRLNKKIGLDRNCTRKTYFGDQILFFVRSILI